MVSISINHIDCNCDDLCSTVDCFSHSEIHNLRRGTYLFFFFIVDDFFFTLVHCLLQRFIKALAISGSKVTREQKRSEKLILALLPPTVAARLIEQKVIF